jgi:hypothetical protein
MEAFEAAPSDATWGPLLRELQAAVFIVPTLLDEADVRYEGGSAVFKKGSRIKIMVTGDPPRLGLFTDWERMREFTKEPTAQGMIVPAKEAWAMAQDYGQAVINPGSEKRLPILPEVLAWLVKEPAGALSEK